ncbi:MAG: hypothetical protein K6T83_21120 [Alicyclobacillus sp.]|nr:hypothetical protein [Alicyclobacillus sp.]
MWPPSYWIVTWPCEEALPLARYAVRLPDMSKSHDESLSGVSFGRTTTRAPIPLPGRSGLELANLVTVATLVARSALERRESRGAHYRTDYPARNDGEWRRHIVITRGRLDFVPLR